MSNPNPKTNPDGENSLRTSDSIRAAALLTCGIKMIDAVTAKDGRRLIFVFDDTGGAARLASACFLQNRQVGIRDFTDNLRRVQELIFQHRLIGGDRDSR